MAVTRLDVSDTNACTVARCVSGLRSSVAMVRMPATETLCEVLEIMVDEIRQLNNKQRNAYELEGDLGIFNRLDEFHRIWRSPEMDSPIVRSVSGYVQRQVSECRQAVAVRIQTEHYHRDAGILHHRRAANE